MYPKILGQESEEAPNVERSPFLPSIIWGSQSGRAQVEFIRLAGVGRLLSKRRLLHDRREQHRQVDHAALRLHG